jgi:hypothetical protein
VDGIVPLSFFAALEGAYTTAWLNNPDSNGVDRLTYRAAEVLLLLVIARVYSWVALGAGIPSPEQMRVFLTSPMTILSVGGFVTTAFVSLVAWWLAVTMSRIFSKLDVSVYEINFYTLSPAEQKAKADDRPIQISRDELQAQFLNTWLMVGMLMVFMAALSTFEVGQLTSVTNPFEITRLGMTPAMLFALMTYFLTGFWLLSHARLLRMNARWLADGVAKEASLERGWQRSAFVVVGIIALIAAFLPIGSTLAISHILTMGLAGLGYVASTIFFFFGNLFASMLMLLTQNAEEGIQQPSEALPPATVEPPSLPPADSNPLLSMIISSAFWALVIAFIIASLLFFLRERGYRTRQYPRSQLLGHHQIMATRILAQIEQASEYFQTRSSGQAQSCRRCFAAPNRLKGSAAALLATQRANSPRANPLLLSGPGAPRRRKRYRPAR